MKTIAQDIIHLGSQIYLYRMVHAGNRDYNSKKLEAINNKLNRLYNSLYHIPNQNENELRDIVNKTTVLLSTIKELNKSLASFRDKELNRQAEILKMNYSALYEINSDLKNFALPSPEIQELKSLLTIAAGSTQPQFA